MRAAIHFLITKYVLGGICSPCNVNIVLNIIIFSDIKILSKKLALLA